MKTILYTFTLMCFVMLSACQSIEKLVEQGRYDEAIVLATQKLAGKKNKKTKHIRALEKAFAKINDHDLRYIETLRTRGGGASWMRIYDYAIGIERRQSQVRPFLPLVSKDGYAGHFELIDINPMIEEAGTAAAEYLYHQGSALLTKAKVSNNKPLAQDAYYAFSKIRNYKSDYKDTRDLLRVSKDLGTYYVLLRWDETFLRHGVGSVIGYQDVKRLDDLWMKHFLDFTDGVEFDAVSTVSIQDIHVGRERELINNFVATKDLESWVPQIDQYGNEVKDTSGNVIRVKQIETVTAQITDITRTKRASFSAIAQTVDYVTGQVISIDEFDHHIDFVSDACDMRGDRRALDGEIIKRLDYTLRDFPTDYSMVRDGLAYLESQFVDHLDRLQVSDFASGGAFASR